MSLSPHRRPLLPALLGLMLSLPPALAGTPESLPSGTPVPRHLELARELVAGVRPEHNRYSYTGPEGVRWAGDLFTSEHHVGTMCTGLVAAVLDRARHPAIADIRARTRWKKHLRIDSFWTALEQGHGLQRVPTLDAVRPGDLFMFRCTTGCSTSEGPALGHIAVIDAPPQPKAPTPPLVEGTRQWLLTVIDAADGPHGRDDTRWRPPGEPRATGVGRGTYRIYTDAAGVPVGYTNGPNAPRFQGQAERPIAIGRPVGG